MSLKTPNPSWSYKLRFFFYFSFVLFLQYNSVFAQDKIWGVTQNGGSSGDSDGVIFKMNSDGTGYAVHKEFTTVKVGSMPNSYNLIQAANGKLYGITARGGASDQGVIFEYTPSSNSYVIRFHFNYSPASPAGISPSGALTQAANGKLYGVTGTGGLYGFGTIFEFDLVSGAYVDKYHFNTSNGTYPQYAMCLGANGKLYGTTPLGGAGEKGTLFEFDPTTGVYTKKIEFNGLAGWRPNSNVTSAANGKIYGTTSLGTNGGTLFEFDPSGSTLAFKYIFSVSATGQSPSGNLAEINNKLYGTTSIGGTGLSGVLYELDLSTAVYTKKFDFSSTTSGKSPMGGLIKTVGGKLEGTTSEGGTNNAGVLFEYDIVNNVFTKRHDFQNSDGYDSQGALLENSSTGKLYGLCSAGGSFFSGTFFELDPSTNVYVKKMDFNFTSFGKFPHTGLSKNGNGFFYGLTAEGGIQNGGTMYELNSSVNPATGFSSFMQFGEFDDIGKNPEGGVAQAANGKMYAITTVGGTGNKGTIYELALTHGWLIQKRYTFTFDHTSAESNCGMISASNGKLYGMTSIGGVNNQGIIYEFDPSTFVFTKKFDFNATTDGANPYGSLVLASNGKLYGMTFNGGVNAIGIIFEYDFINNIFTKKFDFSPANGANPRENLIQASNGKLYGLTSNGGVNNVGVLFEYDITNSTYTKKFDFNPAGNGANPYGSLVQSTNSKLYGTTYSGGINNYGIIFEYDPATGIFAKILDFNGTNGMHPKGALLFDASSAKLSQTITFNPLADTPYSNSGSFLLSATASSNLPVGFSSSNLNVAKVTGSTVTIVGVGTTTITASQIGNATYAAATSVSRTLNITPLSQTITFPSLAAVTAGTSPFTLTSATSSSGLPIQYTSSNAAVATISNGNVVSPIGHGVTTITASQPGNGIYLPAASVTQNLTVNPPTPSNYPIAWKDLVSVVASGNTITKTSSSYTWAAGAASYNIIPSGANGWIEMEINNTNWDIMFGLSASNPDASWNTIEYNCYISRRNGHVVMVYRLGSLLSGNVSPYQVGDKFRVERSGSSIYIKRNGAILYTIAVNNQEALRADVSVYDPNSQIYNAYCSHPTGLPGGRVDEFQNLTVGTYSTDSTESGGITTQVYPNPTTGKVYLKNTDNSNHKTYVRVSDQTGAKISEYVYSPSIDTNDPVLIDLSNYGTGIYLIQVNNRLPFKVMKK